MIKKIASTCSVLSFLLASPLLAQSPSQWVYYDANHHLQYQTDPLGNKILDFSYAGYQGGGVPLPNLPVRVTVQPSGADDTHKYPKCNQSGCTTIARLLRFPRSSPARSRRLHSLRNPPHQHQRSRPPRQRLRCQRHRHHHDRRSIPRTRRLRHRLMDNRRNTSTHHRHLRALRR